MPFKEEKFEEPLALEKKPEPEQEEVGAEKIEQEAKRLSEDEFIESADLVLSSVLTRIRKKRGRSVVENWGYFDLPYFDLLDDKNIQRQNPLVNLTTAGCYHELGRGGCTMCDYGWGGGKKKIEELDRQIEEVLNFLDERNKGYNEAAYNINALGSFFDDREIPPELREKIYNRIAKAKSHYKEVRFITESRLEFITEDELKKMRKIMGNDANIEIGYGVESTDRFIREVCVHKKYPSNFEEKLALMKKYGVEIWTHIILKPPFLTEKEAIEDAIKSINETLDKDWAEQVVLMSMNIKSSSLVGLLEEEGRYKLPSIWSVVEVLKRLGPEKCFKLLVHGFVTATGEEKIVEGCEICDKPIRGRLLKKWEKFKEEYEDLIRVANSIECPCKKDWQEEISKVPEYDLRTRTAIEIDRLSRRYLGRSFFEEAKDRKLRTK